MNAAPPAALSLQLHALSVLAPGLDDWRQARAVLRGERDYLPQPFSVPAPALLPANERRRATAVMRLALAAAGAALAGLAAEKPCAVFASSAGDGAVIDKICTALTLDGRPVSPTQFHNSVHNAPAGYWSIATGCPAPSHSLSAYDGSFAAGLLAAAAQALADRVEVLLVAYDQPLPAPLAALRPLAAPFACALLLSAGRSRNSARLPNLARLMLYTETAVGDHGDGFSTLDDPQLEALRVGNPAARSLPLLRAVATGGGTVALPYLDRNRLRVAVDGAR